MKKIALALAALAATSGAAFAGDFAATLHYPEAPRIQSATPELDRTSTSSILRKIVSSKPQQDKDAAASPVVKASDD